MRVLVWQWGRRGAGPRYAAELADALRELPGTEVALSLSAQAELLDAPDAPACELPVETYRGLRGVLLRLAVLPFDIAALAERLREWRFDVAICAMPAPLDLMMAAALRRCGVPFVVMIHDAEAHPGDRYGWAVLLQRGLLRRAAVVAALTGHVADRLRARGLRSGQALVMAAHPPMSFGPPPPPPRAHGGKLRLLSFGRLLPYKGLDLLADALRSLGPRDDFELRVIGSGPESAALDALRTLPGVRVENRWVSEAEIPDILAWADALVLSHREASQSGVAATAVAAGRFVVATRVGGIAEQLQGEKLARLCEPTADSLADAVAALLDDRTPPPPPADPAVAWHIMAAALLRDVTTALRLK